MKSAPLNTSKEIALNNSLFYFGNSTADYLIAIEIDFDFADAFYNKRIRKDHFGFHAGSISPLNRLIMNNPFDIKTYLNRGCLKYEIGNKDGAVADFSKIIEIDPEYAEAYCLRGFVKSRCEITSDNQALEDFNKAIEIDPCYVEGYCSRGDIMILLRNYKMAIADLTKATEIAPSYIEAYKSRGFAKYLLGDSEGALLDWENAAYRGDGSINNLIEKYSIKYNGFNNKW